MFFFCTYAIALGATLGKLLLVAGHTDKLVVPGDEALVTNGLLADAAAEALLMPLLSAELKLFHTCWGRSHQ